VVIPVFQEDINTFTHCLKTVIENKPDDILVVIDEREKGLYEELLKSLSVRYDYAPPGKREAVAKGIRLTEGEVVFIVDSDTVFTTNTIKEMLKPFKDREVGGVTPEQRILDWDKSMTRRIADWMEDFRWKISNRAMSAKGVVGCLPGRAIALRRVAIEPLLDDFLTETFQGKKCIIGDDRYITSLILKRGYKSVFQSSTKVYTTVPDSMMKYLKMNLRWARSSQRETVKALPMYMKKHYILPLSFLSDIVIPFVFLGIIVTAVTNIVIHYDPVAVVQGTVYDQLWAGAVIGFCGMLLSLGLRHAVHLVERPKDVLFLPVWVLFMTFVMLPIRMAGFFTMGKQEWMTR
jgi:hyaluronan synthase